MSDSPALVEAIRANVRIDGHEKECATFRKAILGRLGRIETILISATGCGIMLLINAVFKVV